MSDLAAIGKASESRWAWLRYLFGSRRIVQELIDEIERGLGLEGRIDDLKDELDSARATIKEKDEAIQHLVRWIQAAHRIGPPPESLPIKRLLFNAQNSRRQ